MATGRVAALQDEIKRHELVYGMLDGRKTGKRSRRGPSTVGSLKRGRRGAMIDWNAVFATLLKQFTLETISAQRTASEKPRAYLRQGGRTVVEGGSDQAHRPGHVPENLIPEETGRDRRSRGVAGQQ